MTGLPDPIRHPGNQALFRALDLSILSTLVGLPLHVHVEGLRGTGKTTIIRSVRNRLPRIQRIRGCLFNCLPWAPHCPRHRGLTPDEVRAIGVEWVPMPFREISHSAKVGTVAGSIDLARIADPNSPEAALLPGSLPQANRGIIFVDEINRLADTAPELADILLDVMGTKPGRLQIEETGLPSVDLPVSISVWAASNPDEDPGPLGDIRKQLSDRFDFVIAMERPAAVPTVREILRASRARLMALTAIATEPEDGEVPGAGSAPSDAAARTGPPPGEEAARSTPVTGVHETGHRHVPPGEAVGADPEEPARWTSFARAVRRVECPAPVEELIASLYIDFGLESLRGVEAIHHGARMNSILEGRDRVTVADVAAVAPGALQHRLDVSTFARVMDFLTQRAKAAEESRIPDTDGASDGGRRAGRDGGEGPAPTQPGILDQAAASLAAATAASQVDGSSGALQTAASGDGVSPPTGPGPESRGKGASGGWLSLWSLLGRRSRAAETGKGPGLSGQAMGVRGEGGGLGSAQGHGSPASLPGKTGQGGVGRPGQPGPGGQGEDRPVAPLHPARPLSEILREMELGGPGPQGPLVP